MTVPSRSSGGAYRHSVSVAGVIIDDDGKFLAIRRRDNARWELPGGILEFSETPEQGVVREVFEETGVHVKVERLTGIYKNMKRGIVALVFRCRQVDGLPRSTEEASEVRWLDDEQLRSLVDEVYAIRFLDGRQDGPVLLRAHDGVNLVQEPDSL